MTVSVCTIMFIKRKAKGGNGMEWKRKEGSARQSSKMI